MRFVGQTKAVQRVELRVRVNGAIEQKFFVDGQMVEAGQKLFQVDPRMSGANVADARAALAKAEALRRKAVVDAERARALFARDAISRSDLDTAVANESSAAASVAAARAAVRSASLDKGYTTIYSPIDGRIGETTVDVGNLVNPQTNKPLATVTRLDPIYVEFALSEREYLETMPNLRAKGAQDMSKAEPQLVALQLADGSIYPYRGRLVFISPEMDRTTGTFSLRALFPNPQRALRPGLFANLIVRSRANKPALLVPEEAIVTTQAGAFVYRLDQEERVRQVEVEVGSKHGALKAIDKGLAEGDRVVALGVHKLRDELVVAPRELPKLDLSSDPLAVALPKEYQGDWLQGFVSELGQAEANSPAPASQGTVRKRSPVRTKRSTGPQ
jgi:membrane fusion protein (multidrug efflux system)